MKLLSLYGGQKKPCKKKGWMADVLWVGALRKIELEHTGVLMFLWEGGEELIGEW